ARVHQHHSRRRQPGAIVDREAWVRLPRHRFQVRPNDRAARRRREGTELLLAKADAAAQQLERGTGQGQRFKVENPVILEEADALVRILWRTVRLGSGRLSTTAASGFTLFLPSGDPAEEGEAFFHRRRPTGRA